MRQALLTLPLTLAMALSLSLSLALSLSLPALAEEDERGGRADIGEGFSLLEEGARLMMRGLMAEVAPLLEDLDGALGDLSLYHAPEILPNGDIIIRRRVPKDPDDPGAAPDQRPALPEGEEIEI